MKVDLHCHSFCSDGEHSPLELIDKAKSTGLNILAVTDHDSIEAYQKYFSQSAESQGETPLNLHTGVELSCQWASHEIHIVGLDFDIKHEVLLSAIESQKNLRHQRAENIAQKLEKKGVKNALQEAQQLASGQAIGRPHFAEVLINQGLVKTHKQAFDRYLGIGKSCYCSSEWPDIAEVNRIIKEAGGFSVLAHPTRYKMTASKLRRLVSYFAQQQGDAIEFVGGNGSKDSEHFLRGLCEEHALMASPASDFHSEKQIWQKLGRVGEIHKALKPVWQAFGHPFLVL